MPHYYCTRRFPAVASAVLFCAAFWGIAALLLLPAAKAEAAPPQTWGLLVGVGDNINPENTLLGPKNDVPAMVDLLVGRYHFLPSHLKVLLDRRAGRRDILEGWNWLIENARPGDTVVFYYSGHGIDIPDASKPIGKDSALCPYDAHTYTDLIPGKEIGKLIDRLQTDRVIVIVDACNSGSASRDLRSRRRSPSPSSLHLPALPSRRSEAEPTAIARAPVFADTEHKEWYIGAAQIDQSASEFPFLEEGSAAGLTPAVQGNPNMGALTYYLLQELRGDPQGRLTYAELVRRVSNDIASYSTENRQTPQVSGPNIESVPFLEMPRDSGEMAPAALPVASALNAGKSGETVRLHVLAGTQLVPGTILTAAGGRRWNAVEASAGDIDEGAGEDTAGSALVRVDTVRGTEASGAVLTGALHRGTALAAAMRPAPDDRLSVAINGSGKTADRLRRRLTNLEGIVLVPPARFSDVTLYASSSEGVVDVQRGNILLSSPTLEADVPRVLGDMRAVKQLADLRSSPDSTLHVTVRTLGGKEGYSEAKLGSQIGYDIWVDQDAYITILDIGADGAITGITTPQLWRANVPFPMDPATVTGQPGLDTLKVIATTFPLAASLPATAVQVRAMGEDGKPAAVAQRVVGALRSAANAQSSLGTKGLDFNSHEAPISVGGWATADMLLRVDR